MLINVKLNQNSIDKLNLEYGESLPQKKCVKNAN